MRLLTKPTTWLPAALVVAAIVAVAFTPSQSAADAVRAACASTIDPDEAPALASDDVRNPDVIAALERVADSPVGDRAQLLQALADEHQVRCELAERWSQTASRID